MHLFQGAAELIQRDVVIRIAKAITVSKKCFNHNESNILPKIAKRSFSPVAGKGI